MKWLTVHTAPIVYAAALLLVAFAAPLRIEPRDLIALNLTTTVLYLSWLFLAWLPRWRMPRERAGDAKRHFDGPSDLERDVTVPGPARRVRVGVRRAPGPVVDDA